MPTAVQSQRKAFSRRDAESAGKRPDQKAARTTTLNKGLVLFALFARDSGNPSHRFKNVDRKSSSRQSRQERKENFGRLFFAFSARDKGKLRAGCCAEKRRIGPMPTKGNLSQRRRGTRRNPNPTKLRFESLSLRSLRRRDARARVCHRFSMPPRRKRPATWLPPRRASPCSRGCCRPDCARGRKTIPEWRPPAPTSSWETRGVLAYPDATDRRLTR